MVSAFQKHLPFRGAATALVTPMHADGSLDLAALRTLVDFQIQHGIAAVVVLGTTGEASTLSDDERRAVIDTAVDAAQGRVPVIVGCGSNDTSRAVVYTRTACNHGADGILAVTPYYNKATDAGLIAHFTAIADVSRVPVILYTVPARTGVSISLPVYCALARHPNIVAVKEASASLTAVEDILASCGDTLAVYGGCDELTLPTLAIGGAGVISVTSNLLPATVSALCDAVFRADLSAAQAISHTLAPLNRALFQVVNPIPVKCACAIRGLCEEHLRLPLCALDAEDDLRTRLRVLLESLPNA